MASADELRLRRLLGEPIPEDGCEDDTLFSDEEIKNLVENNPDVDRAAYEGWKMKAASLSNLVDTTEGNAQRKMSQLLSSAQGMVKMYQRTSDGPTEGRTRIGRIVRTEQL